MRNTLVASLFLVTAACSAEQVMPDLALASPVAEPVGLSVRSTAMVAPITPAAPAASRAPIASSTSPNGPVWIETTCEATPVDAQIAQFKLEYPKTTAVDLGAAALLVDRGNRQELTAWDTDSTCRVGITAPKDVDTVAIARTLLAQLRA